ncbi:V-type ATP synthase subunit I [Porphyromonas crevioricanis JCM 15906]|uniref:ATPase n=3 Tax=Porphyromonas crevioricanis TaxID=393921 RepID=A0A2X4PY77_9PORP|nr:V-type ATPase 116kDa subunit family protein [Porphyromonas crevioricanis]KGN94016.1 ATPase [Porphyromonas crevioricanis]SJZ61943.1 V/A-type H+-transporting ATPase subunit I [Porphyromonas crevioricanis]SQH72847.1 V-type ATP synthase subunit I [Porphyromonas crevioricanis]GAD06052.1 V-type ATP synthase subunit I [Porphyromonas crevioricanis JCM 15906]GAD06998.1 V-type ATP synthase subunit I [Porphyromonas crevioricanis JCM 13913]
MIYKMSKYSFLVFHQEYEAFLRRLRDLGLVHIQESQDAASAEELTELLSLRKEVDAFRRVILRRRSPEAPELNRIEIESEEVGRKAYQEAVALLDRERELEQSLTQKKREVEAMQVWGQYEPQDLERLREAGYNIRFHVVPTSAYQEEWADEYGAVLINSVRSANYFVSVQKIGAPAIADIEEVHPQEKSLKTLQNEQSDLERELEKTQEDITAFADNRLPEILAYDRLLQDRFSFGNALLQADRQADERLMILQGWIPAQQASELEAALDKDGIYYQQMEITDEDQVPIKLKNNFFSRLFEPITKMFSLPNYSELDPTPFFAPFFMLFFALCYGDGGYGAILFIGATILKFKAKPDMKPVCSLFQWLGGAAAIVGALMGTVLGLVMPWAGDDLLGGVSDDYFLNQNNMMSLAIGIGLLQIIFGKFIAGMKLSKQRGFKYGLATFAWGVILIAGCLLLLLPRLFPALPELVEYILLGVIGVAVLIAFFYNSPGKNPLFNFGAGLWNTYNMASGLLGDTLSYIRLFAIGLTGGILGGVFNNLAWNMTEGSIVMRILVMPLILILGHSINIGLATISSLVHPLRLTFVEFYKNAEFEGGGKAYSPFKKS